MLIAQRRSRLQTPIATPGGFMTPSMGRHTPQSLGGGPLLRDPTGQHRMMMPMGVGGAPQMEPPGQQRQYDMPDNGGQFNQHSPLSSTSEKQPLPEDSYEEEPEAPQYMPPPTMRAQPTSKQVYKKAPSDSDMI